MTSPTDPLERLVARAGELYSLPAVAMEVLDLTNNPKVDIAALKECLERDPALTTKVLRVVNSSLFGLSREVSDLSQALSLLGTKPLKLLVLGFSLPDRLFDGVAAEILGWYWRHTLTKAVAAREIAESYQRQSGDEAFIAGLLQDLGILLLIQELGEPYIQFLEKVLARGADLSELEAALFGFDHTALTSRLLEHWGLPQVLVKAVQHGDPPHRAPCAPSEASLGQIVRWAGLLARLLADGHSDVLDELVALDDPLQGLPSEQLDPLVADLEAKVDQLADVLSLRLPEGRDYRDVLVEAHVQLAQIAAEVAGDLVAREASRREMESRSAALEYEFHALSEAVAQVSQPGRAPPASSGRSRPDPAAVRSPEQGAVGASSTIRCDAPARPTGPAVAGIDPGLVEQLHAAASLCRQSQRPLTLLLVELDGVPELTAAFGTEGLGKLRRFVERACRSVDHPGAICLDDGDHGFAVVLPDCERHAAVRLANHLIDQIRQVNPAQSSPGRPTLSVSAGAAALSVPPKNFHPQDLLEAARRCLYASHASGGSVVKSIDVF